MSLSLTAALLPPLRDMPVRPLEKIAVGLSAWNVLGSVPSDEGDKE
jgi:hypothetical protein